MLFLTSDISTQFSSFSCDKFQKKKKERINLSGEKIFQSENHWGRQNIELYWLMWHFFVGFEAFPGEWISVKLEGWNIYSANIEEKKIVLKCYQMRTILGGIFLHNTAITKLVCFFIATKVSFTPKERHKIIGKSLWINLFFITHIPPIDSDIFTTWKYFLHKDFSSRYQR